MKEFIKMKVKVLLIFVSLLFFTDSFSQSNLITGFVRDSAGSPIPNASVMVEGRTTGVVTSSDGSYSIRAEKGNMLRFSCIGYDSKSVEVEASPTINVILASNTVIAGNDVVVVGYGTQRKATVTGSAAAINTSLLKDRPTTSLTNSLQGTTPGLTILSRPGDVGNDIGTINVRGRGNLGSSSPLYVVDGVVVSGNDFARINNDDIENITILKDASAAIYGSRAAYGVILVTTKKGKAGKMQVNYNFSYGWQKPTYLPDVLGSYDFAILMNEGLKNAGKAIRFTDEELEKIKSGSDPDHYPDNNWYNLVYKKSAPLTQHDLTISGGDKTRYFLGLSYMRQGSLVPGKDLNRYSMRANTTTKVSQIFDIASNISFIRDDIDNPKGAFSYIDIARMNPTMVAVQSDGSWGTINGGRLDATLAKNNPLRNITDGGHSANLQNRFLGSVTGILKPMEGLSINGQVSYNLFNAEDTRFINTLPQLINFDTKKPISGTDVVLNSLTERWDRTNSLITQIYATYEKMIQEHQFKIMAGTSYEDYKEKFILAGRKDFVSNDLDVIHAGSAEPTNLSNDGNLYERAFLSYFSRLNYSYKNKYLLEGVFRADASSQFAPEYRWGYYPGISAAWNIAKENFMQNVNWLDDLKIRASYGVLGNVNNVGYYDYFNMLASGVTAVLDEGKVTGYYPNVLANRSISWEKVISKNLGFDGSLFRGKLTFEIDLFDKLTKDILIRRAQPLEFGLTNGQWPATNAAKVSNKGIEVNMAHTNKIGDLSYTIAGNFTKIWNKIVDMYGSGDIIESYWIKRLNEPIGAFYGYKSAGLFNSQQEVTDWAKQSSATKAGDIRFVDQNNDKVINGDDRVILGNDVPYFTYGLNLALDYKGFDLMAIGQGVKDVKVYLSEEASWAFFNGAGVKRYHLGRWQADNPNANAAYPRMLLSQDNSHNQVISDFWLFNADYFRIKSMTLGYTIPQNITNRYKIDKIRFYLSANNFMTIRADKRLKDFDPEAASSRAGYPQLKTVSFGLNINL